MYRIELAPGEETVFRTFEELATGVRNGFITSRARIYHAASQKWLPIEFHPHYKQALENPARHAPVAFAPISASPFSPKENATVAVFPVAVESVTVEPPVMAASSMDSRLPEAP